MRLRSDLSSLLPRALSGPSPPPSWLEELSGSRAAATKTYLLEVDANPVVALVAHVEVSVPVADVPDLLVLVQVLVEEGLDLGLVDVAHLLGRHGDLVPVLVAPLAGQLVDLLEVAHAVVQHAEGLEVVDADRGARVVRLALVALFAARTARVR